MRGSRLQTDRVLLWIAFVFLLPIEVARAVTLNIATVEHTSHWNPVSFESYPALVVTRFTTERLLEKRCAGGSAAQFVPVCLRKSQVINQGSVRLQFNNECRTDENGPLSVKDIVYTLEQINAVSHNDYYVSKLQIRKDRLFIVNPWQPADWVTKSAFDFPIMRFKPQNGGFFNKHINTGTHEEYNRATGGDFKMQSISADGVMLSLRPPAPDKSTLDFVDRIRTQFYDLRRELLQTMSANDRPDIVLAMPATLQVGRELYQYRVTPDLNSFTYVGFNFQTPDAEQRELIRNLAFRELFTRSLWTVNTIEDKVNIRGRNQDAPGIFLGESFDLETSDITNVFSATNIRARIAEFFEDEDINHRIERIEFRVILSPAIEQVFDETDRANIEAQLNEMWMTAQGKGLHFTLVDPTAGSARFRQDKIKGSFHLIFDTFIYGRNPFKYMAFLQPNNALNYLKVDVMSRQTIDGYMQKGTTGVRQFLQQVRQTFPVAVIGTFPRRDLFSTRLQTEVEECGGPDAIQMPYFGLRQWKKGK